MVYGFLTIKNNPCKDKKYYHCAHDDIEKITPLLFSPCLSIKAAVLYRFRKMFRPNRFRTFKVGNSS